MAAIRCGLRMAKITIAKRHSQGMTDESEGNVPIILILTNLFHGTLMFGIAWSSD